MANAIMASTVISRLAMPPGAMPACLMARHAWRLGGLLWLLVALSTVSGHEALAESSLADRLDWQAYEAEQGAARLCQGRYLMPDYRLDMAAAPGNQGKLVIESDQASLVQGGAVELRGDVLVRRDNTELMAERITMADSRDRVSASGEVAVRDGVALLRGKQAAFGMEPFVGGLDEGQFVLYEQRLRGQAQRLAKVSARRFRLERARVTTCDPGSDSWALVGRDVLIDLESGVGTARHARLEIANLPVFYSPWLRFPLDDRRQTGLLPPNIKVNNGRLDLAQPFYLNLAEHQDATLTPRWIGERGLLLGGEFRYLRAASEGRLEGAYLASDSSVSAGSSYGASRWYVKTRHEGKAFPQTRYRLAYGAASDARYFDDVGATLGGQSPTSLERVAALDYSGNRWQLGARFKGFQYLKAPLAASDKPFYQLPSLSARADWQAFGGGYARWRSQATYFWRDVDADDISPGEIVDGGRLHLSPSLGWRQASRWGYLEPRLSLWHTAYEVNDAHNDKRGEPAPSRTLAISQLDAGLFLERDLQWQGQGYRQTLEPRLNYTYVPYRHQNDLPLFDTRPQPFGWDRLWSPTRFSGIDRVGDLNRLSYALSTQWLENGKAGERFSAGIGRSLYLDDRRVNASGAVPDTSTHSPWVARADLEVSERMTVSTRLQYDHADRQPRKGGLSVGYRHPEGHALNLGYRFEAEGFDPAFTPADAEYIETDQQEWALSFGYKASPRIEIMGDFVYDRVNQRFLEQLTGVQWRDCCYGVQLVWRQWLDDNDTGSIEDDGTDRGVFLRFVFKGLGGVGQNTDRYLEQAVPGFRPATL